MSSLRKSAFGIYLSSIAQLLLSIVQGFVLVPLFVSKFGRELYGAWMAIAPILNWITIMDPGFADSIRSGVARSMGAKDKAETGRIIASWLTLQLLIVPLPIIAGYFLAPHIPGMLRIAPVYAPLLQQVFLLSSITASLLLLNGSLVGVLHGLHMGVEATTVLVATNGIGLLATIYLVLHGELVESIPEGLLLRVGLSVSISAGLAWRFCRKNQIPLRVSPSSVGASSLASLPVLVEKVAAAFFRNIDALVVSRLLGTAIVPNLTLTQRGMDVPGPLLSGSSQAVMPSLAHLAGDQKGEQFAQVTANLVRFNVWALAICGGTYIALNRSFMRLWVGGDFFGGEMLTFLLFASAALDAVYYIFFQASLATGLVREAYVNGAYLNVVRGCAVTALTYLLGLRGVPLGAIFSFATLGWVLLPKFFALQPECRTRLAPLVRKLLVSVTVAVSIGVLWAKIVRIPTSWVGLSIQGIVVATILTICLSIIDRDFRERVSAFIAKSADRFLGANFFASSLRSEPAPEKP